MTDTQSATPEIPGVAGEFAHSLAQDAAVTAGTYLVAHGLLAGPLEGRFDTMAAGVFLLALGVAWNWVRAKLANTKAQALLNATPPKTPAA